MHPDLQRPPTQGARRATAAPQRGLAVGISTLSLSLSLSLSIYIYMSVYIYIMYMNKPYIFIYIYACVCCLFLVKVAYLCSMFVLACGVDKICIPD